MPVFNMERYVAAAVSSVLAQTHTDLELIIIDDGGTDRSVQICQQFTDSRIKIIHQKNRGLAGARNAGVRAAKGEYIGFIDADDLWAPQKLERHLTHLTGRPALGVSYSCAAYIDGFGKPFGMYQFPKLRNITPRDILVDNPLRNGSNAVVRRQVLEQIGYVREVGGVPETWYFDEDLSVGGEHECWIRIRCTTDWLFEGLPHVLVQYRANTAGLSADTERHYKSWRSVVERVRTYSPELVATNWSIAEAYELRYAAQRTILLDRDGRLASAFMTRALKSNPRILAEQPVQTILTWLAAQLLKVLPMTWYSRLEGVVQRLFGRLQKLVLMGMQRRRPIERPVIEESALSRD